MSFYWIKTNALIKTFFPNYIWDIPNKNNCVYLTFDDGPTPEITEWVLKLLKEEKITATFFCIGKNILASPDLLKQIIEDGHAVGNHTHNHYNGWKTTEAIYLENTKKCDAIITTNTGKQSQLFRPPYGKIKRGQAKKIKELGYKIIMWDVLSADFDHQIAPEKCLHNVISTVKPGSIIVFHDSLKASKNLKYTLPKAIDYLKQKGFTFETIQ